MKALPCPSGQTPRLWQTLALGALRDAVRGAGLRSVVITAATGTGKGTLLAGLVALYVQARLRVLVLVHRDELIRDLAGRCSLVGVSVGIVKGAENGIKAQAVVASVQSLRGDRLDDLGRVDLVIVDECHHALAPTYQTILQRVATVRQSLGLAPVLHLGLTATPFRTAKNGGVSGLGEVYEAIVYEHGLREAILAGDLVVPQAIRVDTHVELETLQVRGGDYAEADLERLIDHDERNAVVADWYVANGGGARFLGFAVSVAHAERLAAALQARGVACEAVHGGLHARDRAARIAGLRSGALQGLISRDLLFEGFDAPFVSMLLAVRPTASQIIAQQLLGRGLRLHPGKTGCLVVDFVRYLDVLDLSTLPGLSDRGTAPDTTARTLQPGDLVVHRYDDHGVGQILQLVEHADALALVRWRPTEPDAVDRRHGLAELTRAPRDAVELVPIPLRVTGTTETQIAILPGSDGRRAWPWVALGAGTGRDVRRWVAVGERGQQTPTPDGRLDRLIVVVVETSGGWVLWAVEVIADSSQADGCRYRATRPRDPGQHDPIVEPGALGRLGRLRAGEAVLARARLAPPDLSAAWRQTPASDAQIRRLRALRYTGATESVTRGEASALIGAAEGWRAVVAARAENRQRHGKGGNNGT